MFLFILHLLRDVDCMLTGRAEVEFRVAPNKVFPKGVKDLTAGDAHTQLMKGDLAAFYVPPTTSTRGVNMKQANLFLEVYINVPAVSCSSVAL